MGRPRVGAWYRAGKDAWYAYIGGKAVSLGIRGVNSRLQAQEAYFQRLEHSPANSDSASPGSTPHQAIVGSSVGELIPVFMADAELRLKPNTLRIYGYDLERFSRTFAEVRVSEVRADALIRWLKSLPVNDATKRMAVTSVSAFFGWCIRQEYIDYNPFRRVPKPRSKSRAAKAVISPAEHEKMLAAASPQLRDVLLILHATGCRPGEACGITVENFDPTTGIAKLADHKTASQTDKPRLICVPPAECELLAKLAVEVGTGPILRTVNGNPWTARAITERMQTLKKKTGVKKFAYGHRHTFISDALAGGTPEAVTAALVGHTSTAVLHRFYSHLGSNAEVLRKAACAVRGGS